MKIILLLLLFLNGCAVASINTKSVDGKVVECSGYYLSTFKDIDSMSLSACGSKGSGAGSKVNTALIQELLKTLMIP
jgi:hypothetical protein